MVLYLTLCLSLLDNLYCWLKLCYIIFRKIYNHFSRPVTDNDSIMKLVLQPVCSKRAIVRIDNVSIKHFNGAEKCWSNNSIGKRKEKSHALLLDWILIVMPCMCLCSTVHPLSAPAGEKCEGGAGWLWGRHREEDTADHRTASPAGRGSQ